MGRDEPDTLSGNIRSSRRTAQPQAERLLSSASLPGAAVPASRLNVGLIAPTGHAATDGDRLLSLQCGRRTGCKVLGVVSQGVVLS